MNTEEKAQELYPNNKTFCGGVAQIARDAFAKGARMQKEVDDKELSEKVSAAYQLGLADKEKQIAKVEAETVSEDLKKEIERQLAIFPYTKVTHELPESRFLVIQKELFLFARHFAKWGAEHLKK